MNKSLVAKLAAIVYASLGTVCISKPRFSSTNLGHLLDPGMVHGRMVQHAWNLLFASFAAISIAVTLNWRNTSGGYWITYSSGPSLVDLGFIFFVLAPGLVPMWPGLLGPITWIVAWALSTVALREQLRRSLEAGRRLIGALHVGAQPSHGD